MATICLARRLRASVIGSDYNGRHDHDCQYSTEPRGLSRERLKFREESDVPDEVWKRIDEEGLDVVRVCEVFAIRLKHKQTYRSLLDWVRAGRGRTRLELLRRLVERRQGVGYETLAEELELSKRRVKGFVGDLRDKEVVETPGRPALVQFTSTEMHLLASDIAMIF